MSNIYKDAPIVKIVMLKGADGDKSKLSELQNDMTFLTEEQIITLVTNIVDSGSVGDIDTGFVTRLKEQNRGKELKFWVGTQAEYDAIEIAQANTFYIITDDNFKEVTNQAIQALNDRLDNIEHTDYDEEISDLQTRVGLLTTDVGTLEDTAATHTEQIADVTNKVDDSRYAIGDTDTLHFACGALLNRSGTTNNLVFSVLLNKRLSGDVVINVTDISLRCMSNNTYILGGKSATQSFTPSSFTVAAFETHIEVDVRFTQSLAYTQMVAAVSGTANITISSAE